LERPVASDADIVALVNELNRDWVRVAGQRLSPRVLTDLYAAVGGALADFMESLDPHAHAFWPVSWAGAAQAEQWLDIGREFTEVWHHSSQIRDAINGSTLSDPRWLHAVLAVAMHVLPRAYGDQPAAEGTAVTLNISGRAGGAWSVVKTESGWDVEEGTRRGAAAVVMLSDETAGRMLFNALKPGDFDSVVQIEGDARLAAPVLKARSVLV
jgi:hypothetical protein